LDDTERVDILSPVTGQVLFSHEELMCPETQVVKLAPAFARDLMLLRLSFGRPMIVTSCCRSAAHNAAVGGHPRSLHVYDRPAHPTGGTCAIDVRQGDGPYNAELIARALEAGWSVGIKGRVFFHLDRRRYVGLARVLFGYP